MRRCTGWSAPLPPPGATPSTVTTVRPASASSGSRQAFTACSRAPPAAPGASSATAQAPHSPSAHPSLLPVSPRARSQPSNVVCGSTSPTATVSPLSTKLTAIADSISDETETEPDARPTEQAMTARRARAKVPSVREVAEALVDVLKGGGRGALATVVRTSGSVPQPAGARLLLRPDDTTVGTVGGGAVEQAVLEALREARRTGQAQLLARDLGYDLGMCCGGRMEIFVEPVEGAPRLWLFGAGHIARPTAALARGAGFDVTVIDEREELNTGERFAGCARELVEPTGFLRARLLGDGDWLLIVTHD